MGGWAVLAGVDPTGRFTRILLDPHDFTVPWGLVSHRCYFHWRESWFNLGVKHEADAFLFPTQFITGLLGPAAARTRLDGSCCRPGDRALPFCHRLFSSQPCQHQSLPPSHPSTCPMMDLWELPGFPPGSVCEALAAQAWVRAPCWALKGHMQLGSRALGSGAGELAHGSHQIPLFYFPWLFY